MVSDSATMDLDTTDLRAFCRVVDQGSVSAAARSLGETKGSVSRRLSRLEQRVGTALVARAGRRLRPTDEGLAFRERVGTVLDGLDDAVAIARNAHAEPSGHLRLTAPTDVASRLVAPMLTTFLDRHPKVTVELLLTDVRLSFREHGLDLALRAAMGMPDSALVGSRLAELGHRIVASPGYRDHHGLPDVPADLSAHRFLGVWRHAPLQPIDLVRRDDDTRRERLAVPATVVSGDMGFLADAATHGAGIAVLPAFLADERIARGELVEVLDGWRLSLTAGLWLVRPPGPVPPKVRAFEETLRASLPRCSA